MEMINPEDLLNDERVREGAGLLAAFAIGAAVGIALALVWVPERRRGPLPPEIDRRLRRARKAGARTLDDVRERARGTAGELREDVAAILEAAREELVKVAGEQIEKAREVVERELRELKR